MIRFCLYKSDFDKDGNISNNQRNGLFLSGTCYTQALLDNMTYTYTSGSNKISSISDAANVTQGGFRAASGAFTYDNNGNQISNAAKGITSITYNHLNLPSNITLSGSRSIDFTYAADGTKLRKVVKTGATINLVQEYVNGIEYRGTVIPATTIEGIYHAEGRLYNNAGNWQREYVIKDHLGDTRIAYCDINNDGVIATPSEILQENNYDAFGYGLDGVYMNHSNPDNLYQYNGKEKNDDHGIGMYDYGARWYDAGVGRFNTVDRFAEKYSFMTPYQYGANNPMNYIDINGDSIRISTGGNNYIYYTPGQKYEGNDNFVSQIINTLNIINTTDAGATVLKGLTNSKENYDYQNEKPSNTEAGASFTRNKNGGGITKAGRDRSVASLSHELFHAFQSESKAIDPRSTSSEVEAYLFSSIVDLQRNSGFESTLGGKTPESKRYASAYNNLLYNEYDSRDYIRASLYFKFGDKNSSGIYNNTKIKIPSRPIIRPFIPVK
jgi:RHS repeat-associated protein